MSKLFTAQSFEDPALASRLELTSLITCYLLRDSIADHKEYEIEASILDALRPEDEQLAKDFTLFRIFNPTASQRLLNRYNALKNELEGVNANLIFIGACGLSPLGVAYAQRHKESLVVESDLGAVVNYRQSRNMELPNNYRLIEVDLLDNRTLIDYITEIGKSQKGDISFALAVEGFTFYLDKHQQSEFHDNMQRAVEALSKNAKVATVNLLFDYYISEEIAKQADVVSVDNPNRERFDQLFGPIADHQKINFKSRQQVISFLLSQGYRNVTVSQYSAPENPHTVFVCNQTR